MVRQPEKFPGFDELAYRYPGVEVVHPRSSLCLDGACLTDVDGEFIFRDANHLRRNLSPEVRARLADMIGLSDAVRAHAAPSRASQANSSSRQ